MDQDFNFSPPPQIALHPETPSALNPLPDSILKAFQAFFPTHLNFYHLGTIELCPRPHRDRSEDQRISYPLEGDLRGQFRLRLPQSQDSSLYLEIGNILLGRFTTQLSEKMGLDVIFSPPQLLASPGTSHLQPEVSPLPKIHLSYRFLKLNTVENFDADLEIFQLKEISHAECVGMDH